LRFAIPGHRCRKEILATWLGHADARQVIFEAIEAVQWK
jgi:hypothetical protein